MKLASEMKNLSEEVLASFKQRVKETEERVKNNVEFINEVQKTLDGLHKDHQEMAAVINANATTLRKGLAQGEKERLNTFNGLMSGIHSTISILQKEVHAIQSSTLNLLSEFAASRAQMTVELEKLFTQGRSDRAENEKGRMKDEKQRIKDFDALMKNINADLKGINDEVLTIFKNTNDILEKFEKEHQEMSVELKAELSKNLTERVNYTKSLLSGFQARLLEIGKENQELAKEMRNDLAISQKNLASSDVERIKNYKAVMVGIQTTIKEIRKEVNENLKATSAMIADFSLDRSQAAAEWKKMQGTIAQIRKNGIEMEKKVEKKAEKVVEKKAESKVKSVEKTEKVTVTAPKVEKTKATSAAAQPVTKIEDTPVKAEPTTPTSLEDKIVDFISKHPKGVRISEMEKPLGETRMKLGYIAKKLLDSGKVQKIDNIYFPIK